MGNGFPGAADTKEGHLNMAPDQLQTLLARFDQRFDHMERKIDNNREVLDDLAMKVVEHHASEEPRWAVIDDCHKTVFGTSGLVTRVDRIEGWRSRVVWILTSIVAPLGVYACYVAMQHVSALRIPVLK